MKKHIFPIFLSILLPFSAMLCSCSTESEEASTPESESEIAIAESETVNEEATSDTSDTASEEASDNTSSDVSDESDEAIKNEPITRPTDYPTLCGSFMQSTMFKDYSYDRMKAHLQNLI